MSATLGETDMSTGTPRQLQSIKEGSIIKENAEWHQFVTAR